MNFLQVKIKFSKLNNLKKNQNKYYKQKKEKDQKLKNKVVEFYKIKNHK